MSNIYTNGQYLAATRTWHAEDSPWKAAQIHDIIRKNKIRPASVAEVGCGAGGILFDLSQREDFETVDFKGFDISQDAIDLAKQRNSDRVKYFCEDFFKSPEHPDILLVIDVFEHIPDYLDFVSKCRSSAKYKIYHIPLDIHISSVLRDTFDETRYGIGHIHAFTQSSAIATLMDTGHEIIDQCYTNGAMGLYRHHPSFKRALANGPRWLLSQISVPLTARLLGGYSLLVLAK